MLRSSILVLLFLFVKSIHAQKEDHIWLFGSDVADNINITTIADTLNGATNFDFNFDPPKIHYDSTRIWDIRTTNASICDTTGNLLLYTNGQVVYSGDHTIVEDTINYNAQWDNWNITVGDVVINDGLPTIQGALILKQPDTETNFFIFYNSYNLSELNAFEIKYSVANIYDDLITVVEKDKILFEGDTLSSGNLNAIQHANGRDWWIIFSSRNHSCFHKYLLTPEGISYDSNQCLGDPYDSIQGQLYFSNDGSKLGMCSLDKFGTNGAGIYIADFDRATGNISNVVQDFLEGNSFSQGLSFSPNNRFLYATDSENVYQYDLQSSDIIASRENVASYDGYIYFYPFDSLLVTPLITEFGWMALAPDGKIYISTTTGSSRRFHRINNPNLKGEDCDVDQHSIVMPTSIGRGVPNFPNFRLGPLDGSVADTLGLDNHPIAKYRYVKDSLEDLRVHFYDLSYYDPLDYLWDFGDGNSSTELEPFHTYAEKGVYEVCLTVSNAYDTNTSCRTIMLGTTSTGNKHLDVDVSIYPNPTSDFMTINFHNYSAIHGTVHFFDQQGRLVLHQKIRSASQTLDLRKLSNGIYSFVILDGQEKVFNNKVIIQK